LVDKDSVLFNKIEANKKFFILTVFQYIMHNKTQSLFNSMKKSCQV